MTYSGSPGDSALYPPRDVRTGSSAAAWLVGQVVSAFDWQRPSCDDCSYAGCPSWPDGCKAAA